MKKDRYGLVLVKNESKWQEREEIMNNHRKTSVNISYVLLLLLITVTSVVHAFNLTVTNENGAAVDGFKWTLEENLKFDVTPGVQTQNSLSLSFHNSYSPVVASGECTGSCSITADPGKQYFITVLPFVGHTVGGATFSGGDSDVTVAVHTHAIPTAQITVRIFHDNHPINGAPDDPEELGLPPTTGQFTVHLADAGGRFGQTGGEVIQDAFGNPLGTEYDPLDPGVVVSMGTGVLTPDAEGYVYIKNIPPAKYGITVVPPTGEGWIQTSTIEGTKTIDAWVLANEPSFFVEFGPPGPHAFVGFVKQFNSIPGGGGSVSGRITNNHMTRPPEVGFFSGSAFGGCWVGLNETVAAGGLALYAAPCGDDSSFNITGIADGTYDLVIWDENLDIVIATRTITLSATTPSLALGDVPVFAWFGRTEARVFFDVNENGFRDPEDTMIPEQATAFRFRNGTPYQAFATDLGGEAPYDEIFPFFHWLVAEVDFTRYKATGVTYVVDGGGEISPDNGWDMPSFDVLNPQPQVNTNVNTGNNLSTTLTGPVISLASQVFLGQTNVIEWGKTNYGDQDVDNFPYGNFPATEDVDHDGDGEFEYGNGGISGMALYAITRAENDPRYAAAEEWEPGIPRIQMNLYSDTDGNEIIDDIDGVPGVTLADVDNAPQGNFPGSEDVDRNMSGDFDYGDAIQVTYTDSWDDSLPTGCAGDTFVAHPGTPIAKTTDCFDGLRNFNQLREGVYDGGYAFTSRIARDSNGLPTGAEIPGLLSGYYIVESAVPDSYVLMKEEDKNVDFGDEYVPALLPPICVGDSHTVPDYLSYQTDSDGNPFAGIDAADLIEAPYAGMQRPLCDRKYIALTAGKNAAADFFMFTQAPIAAHLVGGILNDLGNEFDPNNPNFGEKFSPPWVPVTFYDWAGTVVTKVYADEFGKFEALVPSTATVNIASPSGMAPNMLNACMNDPSPIPNPAFDPTDITSAAFINDPFYNPQFSTFCYTFQYMPGSTTYLDTPVVPVGAFVNAGGFPLDCAVQDNKPVIKSVSSQGGTAGPYLSDSSMLREIRIVSEGMVDVPNHLFGAAGESLLVSRNYGFGDTQGAGTVFLGMTDLTTHITSWSNDLIKVNVPVGVSTGQLTVTTNAGNKSPRGITVTTHLTSSQIRVVTPSATSGATPIQDAIDHPAVNDGDLISISPGTYSELIIMDKPVQLQGWGAGVTRLSAIRTPPSKLEDWRMEIVTRAAAGNFDYLPNQEAGFLAETGSGIIVLGLMSGNFTELLQPRIDGMEITGANTGGGIFVNAYVDYLNISNNRITGNDGTFGGGIRIGNPAIIEQVGAELVHVSSDNDFISIHDNEVVFNGTTFGSAGGIGLYTGSNNYTVDHNFICGNFAQDNGAGIAHLGLSDNGKITNNTIVFNQNFNQGRNVHGGGLFIGGQPGLGLQETEGSGNVVIEANLIQGNSAGAGLGGGIILSQINGVDVANNTGDSTQWYGIDIFDNMIVNNHAGWTGAGIAMQDAAKVRIINNTIAHNDATATVGNLFVIDNVAQTAASEAQDGAGIVSFAHSAVLATNSAQAFSNPDLQNNIIWENRTFGWEVDASVVPAIFGLVPGSPVFSDLGVVPATAGTLNSTSSILTGGAMDPGFILDYFNTDRSQTVLQTEQTANTLIGVAVALDEGGNFVDVQFGPLSISGNYHLRTDSDAIDAGVNSTIPELANDIDGEARVTPFDIGADELVVAVTPDTDGDGVVDTQDNCTLVPNPDQRDTDADGYGNICDADLDNSGLVGFSDFILFRTVYGSADPDADFDNTGLVGFSDFIIFRTMYGSAPGPSGLVN
jgi:hypothetical protein